MSYCEVNQLVIMHHAAFFLSHYSPYEDCRSHRYGVFPKSAWLLLQCLAGVVRLHLGTLSYHDSSLAVYSRSPGGLFSLRLADGWCLDLFMIHDIMHPHTFWPQPLSNWLRAIVAFAIWALPNVIVVLSPNAPGLGNEHANAEYVLGLD